MNLPDWPTPDKGAAVSRSVFKFGRFWAFSDFFDRFRNFLGVFGSFWPFSSVFGGFGGVFVIFEWGTYGDGYWDSPLNGQVTWKAANASEPHIDLLAWAREHGCPMDPRQLFG